MKRNKERKPYVRPEFTIFALNKCELLATSIYIYEYEEDEKDDETFG